MTTPREEAAGIATDGAAVADKRLDDLTSTFDEIRNIRMGGKYVLADVTLRDYDHRETGENADPERDALKEVEAVARLNVVGTETLGNPRARRSMTEAQKAYSMWTRYAEVMSRYDESTANLLTELAQTGWRLGRETAEKMEANRSGASKLSDTRRRAERGAPQGGFSDRFLVVASTEGEARIVRAWIDFAMQYVGDGQTMGDARPTRFNVDRLPPREEIGRMLRDTRPGFDRKAGGLVGFVVAPGGEATAIDMMTAMPGGVKIAPGAGRELWKQISANKALKGYVHTVDVKRGEKDERINEKVAYEADRLVAVVTGDPQADADVMKAIARAFQAGTLHSVVSADGRVLSPFAWGETASELHPTRAEIERSETIAKFMGVEADSPRGRMFLSMLPKVSQESIELLARSGHSIAEILTMARNEQGKASLWHDFKLSSDAIQALGDDRMVARTAGGLEVISDDLKKAAIKVTGPDGRDINVPVAIVTPEGFPGNLGTAEGRPPFLYVQGLDPSKLKDLQGIVAFVGDDKMPAYMANRAAQFATALDARGATIAQVEGQGMPRVVPNGPSVLFLTTGHAHVHVDAKPLEWKKHEDGLLLEATGVQSTYKITLDEPADGAEVFTLWDCPDVSTADKLGKVTVAKPDPSLSGDQLARAKADYMRKRDEAINELKVRASGVEAHRVRQPDLELRRKVIENGGFVVSALPPRERNQAYRYSTGTYVGYPTVSTPETRREAARIAVKASDALCVTYTRDEHMSAAAIGEAITSRRGMIAVSVPESRKWSPSVEKQAALASLPGVDLVRQLSHLPAEVNLRLSNELADKRICGSTGENPEAAADRVADHLKKLGREVRSPTPEARQAEETKAEPKTAREASQVEM